MVLLLVFLASLVAAVIGDDGDTQFLDKIENGLPKPPPYPDTPERKATYFAGISSTVWILLCIKLIFIVIALVSLFIWCRQRNRKTMYAVHA